MAIFPAKKSASLSSVHFCVAVWCTRSYPHGKNVTCHICDITPRDARRKQKYIFLLRKMTKII